MEWNFFAGEERQLITAAGGKEERREMKQFPTINQLLHWLIDGMLSFHKEKKGRRRIEEVTCAAPPTIQFERQNELLGFSLPCRAAGLLCLK